MCRSDVGEEVKRTELDLYIASSSKIILQETKDLPTDQSSVLLQVMKKRVYLMQIK